VNSKREGDMLAVPQNQTILEAGESMTMELPNSCRQD
jgi:ferredoxin